MPIPGRPARAAREGAECVTVSAAVEAETNLLAEAEEHAPFLMSPGPQESGLDRLIRAGHRLLSLIIFNTAGAAAPEAVGHVHTDFE